MNKLYLLLVFLLSTFMDIQGQVVAVKTNVLYDAITTPNVGAEVAFNKHWSVEASGYYNGWTFSSDKSFKHWMIQPEARYWIHERFNGHFFGVHAQYTPTRRKEQPLRENFPSITLTRTWTRYSTA